ncbi:DUF6366 family protein [Paraliobacillus zengyii]|uniref:DUF6366 family protein n=1 Tax=Paraliobacillus zengyii TaxID=2213194 RepID=UPI000DD2C930|nr:DUF6366 family protein [Paraliobacillus zengyii]
MNQNDQERKRLKELSKNPMGNFSDSINRSATGDLGGLAQGGCLTKLITLLVIIGAFLILSQCSF